MKVDPPFLLIAATRILFPGSLPTIMATRTPSGATRSVLIAVDGGQGGTTCTRVALASVVGSVAGRTSRCDWVREFAVTQRFPRPSQLSDAQFAGKCFSTAGGFFAASSFLAS